MKSFLTSLRCILVFLPAFIGLSACQQEQLVDEKMKLIEGYYYPAQLGLPFDNPEYLGQVFNLGGKWVFRFTLIFKGNDGSWNPHTFTQGVTWNSIVGTFIFESFSVEESQYFLGTDDPSRVAMFYEPGRIVLIAYGRDLNGADFSKVTRFSWTKAD